MQEVYAGLPGVSVEPLHFASSDISADRLLAMMKANAGERASFASSFIYIKLTCCSAVVHGVHHVPAARHG
jgi:hypothetical protein